MKKITLFSTVLLSTACFLIPNLSFAQTGSLDLSFDTDGKAITPVSPFNAEDNARSVAIQSDGKIVAAGYSLMGDPELSTDYDFAVVRYNIDGSLDTSFDSDGKVTTDINGNSEDQAYSVAIQSDGKIVVAGYTLIGGSNYEFVVVRYDTDGSLDSGFGSSGIVATPIGMSIDIAYSVAIQTDGKVVVAGYSFNGSNNDFAVVRYNTNGTLDTSFDSDGIVTTAVGASIDMAYSVAIQTDGKIVVSGESIGSGSDYDFAVVRYNTDGSLDTGFDTDGKVTSNIVGVNNDRVNSVVLQSDGKIVAAGYTFNGGVYHYAVVRYNTDGSLDTGFDTDGIVTTILGNIIDIAYSVALQIDGKIVAAGYSFNGSNNDVALVRYNTNGSLDTGFDSDGIVTTPVGTSVDAAYGIAIQTDGKLVVAGQTLGSGSNYDFALVRYNNNTSGISTIDNQNIEMMIYPNPATDVLTISTSQPTEISVCTINGIEILKANIENEQIIDLSGFATGVYFVNTTQGRTLKFIKQ